MSDDLIILLTQTDGQQLFKTVLKCKFNDFPEDSWKFFGEPEIYNRLLDMLPLHCRENGKIVATESIYECVIKPA
jgi:hypothetical protein